MRRSGLVRGGENQTQYGMLKRCTSKPARGYREAAPSIKEHQEGGKTNEPSKGTRVRKNVSKKKVILGQGQGETPKNLRTRKFRRT